MTYSVFDQTELDEPVATFYSLDEAKDFVLEYGKVLIIDNETGAEVIDEKA